MEQPDRPLPENLHFEEIEHTADWALRVRGRTLTDLFIHAALGMGQLLTSQWHDISPNIERRVGLESIDAESLLVDWLSELAYWAEMEQLVFVHFEPLHVTPTRLTGTIYGGRVANLKKHIKAVTYHNLQIIKTESGLAATVVFDV